MMLTAIRYSIPTVDSFKGSLADDEFEIDMAKNDEEKQHLRDARASKVWRTLRIASKSKFKLFHKIEDGNNLDVLFEAKSDEHQGTVEEIGIDTSEDDPAASGIAHSADGVLEIPQ